MPTTEAGLQRSVVKAIARQWPGCWIFNVVGSPYQAAGVPDLLVCVQGQLFGVELKFQRPGESRAHAVERATPQQRAQIGRINRAGGVAGVVTTPKEALDLIGLGLENRNKERASGPQHH